MKKPTVHTFRASADIKGWYGSSPRLTLTCRVCGRGLFGDWEYNFTDAEAHAACVRDGLLDVTANIVGLLPFIPEAT
jgi:hypothetical protein